MYDKLPQERDALYSGRSGASTYRFIIVAAKRARQLQGGARPFLPTTSKKPTVIAMEEVRRGLVKYDDTDSRCRASAAEERTAKS